MANHKSAEKRARQTVRRNVVNTHRMSKVKTTEKKLRAAIALKDVQKSDLLLREFSSQIRKAVKNGIIHLSQAARKTSRLATQIAQIPRG